MEFQKAKDPKVEYVELCNNLRHYSNLRFAELTICLAVTAVLINFVYSNNLPLSAKTLFEIAGCIVTVLFWAADISDMFLWTCYIRRAAKMESSLGYNQYSSLPGAPAFLLIRPATLAIWLFYLGLIVFWILLLTCGQQLTSVKGT